MKAIVHKRRYITGFNGLRTLGVVGVILYHLNPNIFAGGYLGVLIFLGLTGYLITDQILRAWHHTGHFDLGNYYRKRVKRLYPALCTMLWGTCAYIVCFQRNLLQHLGAIVCSNLANVFNFWEINHGQSYFERFANNESPFNHLWTLSLQGQFYFLSPIILLLLLHLVSERFIKYLLLLLTLLSAALMAALYKPHVDPSRIYYGSDTRLFSLTWGMLLAFIWPTNRLRAHIDRSVRYFLDICGGGCLICILILMLNLSAESPAAYQGGMFFFSFLTTVLIAVVAHPSSLWNKLLTNPVFNWIGQLSYGLYLYQFPIMIFFESKVKNIAAHPYFYALCEIVLILIVSAISYYFIERPLIVNNWGIIWWRFWRYPPKYRGLLTIGVVSFLGAMGTGGIIQSLYMKPPINVTQGHLEKNIQHNRQLNSKNNQKVISKLKTAPQPSVSKAQIKKWHLRAQRHPINQEYQKMGISQYNLQRAQDLSVLAIGDSVMVNGADGLRQIFPNMIINAEVSRQPQAAIDILQDYRHKQILPAVIVIGLGTNGPVNPAQIQEVLHLVGPKRQVFWITVHVPTRSWEQAVNNTLKKQIQQNSNLYLIDWQKVAQQHPNWFYADQVHTNAQGSKNYSFVIAQKILQTIKY